MNVCLIEHSMYIITKENRIRNTYHTVSHKGLLLVLIGPLLFTLQINNMYLALKKCNILMYADDSVLYYSSNRSDEIEKSINSDLKIVSKWLASNDLMVDLKGIEKANLCYMGLHKNYLGSLIAT